ncbi:MAG: hypothetical protein ACI855_004520, partial [Myxococcota bacterium]
GFDVVIVVASSAEAASFWRQRLAHVRNQVLGPHAELVVTEEVWAGGAGNGLGTLHGLEQAEVEMNRRGCSLWQALRDGKSVGMWHTAGKGKRLYPLPIHHRGDKSRTVVPGALTVGGTVMPMRLLEAVLRQTSAFAEPGRIGVFWGDQLTLPTVPMKRPTAAVALIGRLGPVPDAAAWKHHGLVNYGLLAVRADGSAMQLEKLEWSAFDALRPELGPLTAAATSLGSFSMTAEVGRCLMTLFEPELRARTSKLDTDPGWWMPLTLPEPAARRLCGAEAVSRLRDAFDGPLRLEVLNVGETARWWDFGTLESWHASCRAVLASPELRQLLNTPEPVGGSVFVGSSPADGAKRSVIVGSTVNHLDVTDAVVVDCDVDHLQGSGVAYGLSGGQHTLTGGVLATDGQGGTVIAPVNSDGKSRWSSALAGNAKSWSEYAEDYSLK